MLPSWLPTRALGRAVLFASIVIVLGAFLGRADLIVLAMPFALGTALALSRRPTAEPTVGVAVAADEVAEGDPVGLALQLDNPDPRESLLVVGAVDLPRWLEVPGGTRSYALALPPGTGGDAGITATATHWGRHEIGPVRGYAVAADGLLVSAPVRAPGLTVSVLPAVPAFRAGATMPRSSALVGSHRSRRPGEGGDFTGVRPFATGDRLRRINWRVSLRTGALHVSQSLSDRDAEVVVLLDVAHEAGETGGIAGTASVTDTAVRAAAAIVEHYLRQGDRVGLIEFSGTPRVLRVGVGRRHLRVALDWLLSTRQGRRGGDLPQFGIDPGAIPPSALVIVLTPLLGARSTEMIATLARAGRSVVAVDTLGSLAARRPVTGSRTVGLAHRLWWLERSNLVGQLREAGVPVTPWIGPGSLDTVLQDMAMMAAAPRLGGR